MGVFVVFKGLSRYLGSVCLLWRPIQLPLERLSSLKAYITTLGVFVVFGVLFNYLGSVCRLWSPI